MSDQAVSGWVQFSTPDDRCGVVLRAIEGALDGPVADYLHVLSITVQQLQSHFQRCVPLPGICPAYSHPESLLRPNRHYSRRTEQAYAKWIREFIVFHDRQHPRTMKTKDVNSFLTHLAADRRVAASTQNQAHSALLFLYKHVLQQPLDKIDGVIRARRPKRLPDGRNKINSCSKRRGFPACLRNHPGFGASFDLRPPIRPTSC